MRFPLKNKNQSYVILIAIAIMVMCFFAWKIFFQCCNQIIDESVHISLDPANSLRIKVTFETRHRLDFYIKYWKTSGDDRVQFSKTSNGELEHEIVIVDLVQNEQYNFQIITIHQGCKHTSKEHSFTSGKVPIGLTPLYWHEELEQNFEGYILAQRRTVKGNVFIINREGQVIWYHKIDGMVKVSNWTVDNTILVLYGDAKHKNSAGNNIIELDIEGNTLLHLKVGEGDFNNVAHHEVLTNKEGNILALIYDKRNFNLSHYGGSANDEVTGDGLILMDRKGKQIWKWSVFDTKNPLDDPSILEKKDDWGHANAVFIDKDGNYLVSFRDWNQIWKINATSGKVMWTFGENGDITLEDKFQFSGQHSIHINNNGDYMLFDNGLKNRKSRAMAYSINEKQKKAEATMAVDFQDELYADRMGSAYLLKNNRILFCSPRSHSLVISDLNGDIVSHADLGIPEPYRANYIERLYIHDFDN